MTTVSIGLSTLPIRGLAERWIEGSRSTPGDERTILYANALTIELALDAAQRGVAAVVTQQGSFACHGANLLRSSARNGRKQIVWVSDVDTSVMIDGPCEIQTDGVFQLGVQIPPCADHIGPADIVRVSTSSITISGRCYWPHRQYDQLTASLMMPGLGLDASRLARSPVVVNRADSGHLWFSGSAPSIPTILASASDPKAASLLIDDQIKSHQHILQSLKQLRTSPIGSDRDVLDRLLIFRDLFSAYFSHFLLLHNTYEKILAKASDHFGEDILTCKLTEWLWQEQLRMPVAKDLLEAGEPLPIPPFTVIDEIESIREGCSGQPTALRHARMVFAAKEWKFFTNKVMYRDFSRLARDAVQEHRDYSELRSLSFEQLLGVITRGRP